MLKRVPMYLWYGEGRGLTDHARCAKGLDRNLRLSTRAKHVHHIFNIFLHFIWFASSVVVNGLN